MPKNKNGDFIVCLVGEDGELIPQGDGKSREYADEIMDQWKKYAPRRKVKLFQLVEVKNADK